MIEAKDDDIRYFIQTIKSMSEYNIEQYSIKSLKRRIEKILTESNSNVNSFFSKHKNYQDIINAITVNTTELFRDKEAWNTIRYRLLSKLADKNEINIWHAGCSSGQEVYSMLILLNELDLLNKTNVIATDINTSVLDKAKKGEYRYRFNLDYLKNFDNIINKNPYNFETDRGIPYDKYMDIDKKNDIIKMKPFLLKNTNFVKHDLVKDNNPSYKNYDIILCRNVLIYFNFQLQDKLFNKFHNFLKFGGYLVIGKHESLPISSTLPYQFTKKKLYYEKKQH